MGDSDLRKSSIVIDESVIYHCNGSGVAKEYASVEVPFLRVFLFIPSQSSTSSASRPFFASGRLSPCRMNHIVTNEPNTITAA